MVITEADILSWLEEVKDPEIPVLSLIDLGVIRKVAIEDTKVIVTMTPTFSGCPAIDMMKDDICEVLGEHGIDDCQVNVTFKDHWNSDMITEKGRKAIKQFGIAPPPANTLVLDLDILENINCPHCDSDNTELKTPFGPTLCRSMHYCHSCRQAFEQFKPLQ